MGKASSNKKVARAASTSGGRTAGGRTPWIYYVSIITIVVVGTALVYFSRSHRLSKVNTAGASPPVVGQDHWHEAYAFYVCTAADKGEFIPVFPYQTDPEGIHTHGDGVIDIHPYEKSAAGKNAVLGVFTKVTGVTLNAGELKIPSFTGYSGHDYHDSDNCGGTPGRVQVTLFPTSTSTDGTLWTKDPRDAPLTDQSMIVVSFMPKGAKIPAPPKANVDAMLHPLDVPATSTPSDSTTTVPGAPTTTVAGATTTTAPGPATTTVAPATTSTSVK
ncbi:MAG: hypothetical protein QOF30_1384 [Acidimicrobiaceae bacterium]|jgi:hypothetical protein|nr:hypothetical protein [Acidimicrobiaceae bacterium]